MMEKVGFIVGTGRCGSTITAKLLNAHSHIVVPHELQILVSVGNGDRLYDKYSSGEAAGYDADDFIALIEETCPYRFDEYFDYPTYLRGLTYPQRDLAVFSRGMFDAICRATGKSVFLEQTPWYGQKLDELDELFPGMKVVHVIRDGRDVAISFSRTPWWFDDIEMNLRRWTREIEVIAAWGEKHPDRYLTLRYEDLVADPEETLSKGLRLFDLEFESGMLDPGNLAHYEDLFKGASDHMKSRENRQWEKRRDSVLFSGSIDAWRRYEGFDFATRTPRHTARALTRFRYETHSG